MKRSMHRARLRIAACVEDYTRNNRTPHLAVKPGRQFSAELQKQ